MSLLLIEPRISTTLYQEVYALCAFEVT